MNFIGYSSISDSDKCVQMKPSYFWTNPKLGAFPATFGECWFREACDITDHLASSVAERICYCGREDPAILFIKSGHHLTNAPSERFMRNCVLLFHAYRLS